MYVVAFNRDRDFYQVPLALEQEGMLERLVTDFYLPRLGPAASLPGLKRLRHRRVDGLPFGKVSWNRRALQLQLSMGRNPADRLRGFKELDRELSRAALAEALRRDAHLLLYSGYAREAFAGAGSRLKGLFVYHPHGALSRSILCEDFEKHPEAGNSHRLHLAEIELADDDRLTEEAGLADFVLCASSFTASSLRSAGLAPADITVVPYGCFPPPARDSEPPAPGGCRFLFVGQGVQRKGLHHLLKAWSGLRLPGAVLTVVASSMDPGIARLIPNNSVRLLGPQSRQALQHLYAQADIFVMPSLVEGFGLVFLEALTSGCFAIGTGNTGLPDLNCPEHVARTLTAGDLGELSAALEHAYLLKAKKLLDRPAIRGFSETLRWDRFRGSVAAACRRRLERFHRRGGDGPKDRFLHFNS